MNIKWFRLLFPPINGNLRQLSLRRTAPQSKIISKYCRPSRLASTLHQQTRVDIIKKNAELLDEICIKTKLNSATGLPIEKDNSNQSLKKKSSPFLRTRSSSRCFINQGPSKLSKKISTIERFHQICQENRNAIRVVSSGENIIGPLNAPMLGKANDRTGFLSRPTTRRNQQHGLSTWAKPIYPATTDAFGRKESSENLDIVQGTILQTKTEFNNRDIGKRKRRNYQGVESAAPPMATFVAQHLMVKEEREREKEKSSISLKKTSKAVDLAGQNVKVPKVKESTRQFGTTYQNLKEVIFKPSASSVLKEKACESDTDTKALQPCLPVAKKIANYHLVRNPVTGKLEIKMIKTTQLQQKIESARIKIIPPDLSERVFKEQYLHNLTPAKSVDDLKDAKTKGGSKIQSEADYAELLQKKKRFEPFIKPTIRADRPMLYPLNVGISLEEGKLLWQKKIRSNRSLERLRKAKELEHLHNAYMESNELKHATPNTNLMQEMEKEAYGKYPEAVYLSFCDLAKRYDFFQYVPRPRPKIRITYPTYTLDFAKLERKSNGWTKPTPEKSLQDVNEILPTINYPSKKRAQRMKRLQEVRELIAQKKHVDGNYTSAAPRTPQSPKGLLAMCRLGSNEIAALDVPRRDIRGAHALFRHRVRPRRASQVKVTHNIKKSSTASAENVFRARLRKRGIRSYRLSQNRLMSENQMDLLSNLENQLHGSTSNKDREREKALPMATSPTKSHQSLASCKHCGLIHGKDHNCQCPAAEGVKGSDAATTAPCVNAPARRSYSTSCKNTVYLTTAEELVSVCRYCGLVHNNPNQVCPMTEALKLFAAKKQQPSFKLVPPMSVNKIAKKKMLMQKIKKLQDNVKLFKKAKMINLRRNGQIQGLVPLPPRNVTFSKPTNFLGVKSGLKTCFKSFEKSKLTPPMKYFSHCKKMNDEELAKFTKCFSELLKYLVSGRNHHQNFKLLPDKMQNIAEERVTPTGQQKEQKFNDVHDEPSPHPARKHTPGQEDLGKIVPEVQLMKTKKVGSISNVSRAPDTAYSAKCSFEISCKKINSTRSSSTGQRNFNTSCVCNTTRRTSGSEASDKRLKDNQAAEMHKQIADENSMSDSTRRRSGRSGIVDITTDTYQDPQMPKNWAQYKSLAEHRKEARANERKPSSNKSPEAIYKEMRRKECIAVLKQQADMAEHHFKKSRSEPRIRSNKKRAIKISLGNITKMGEVTNKSDLVLKSSKTHPVVAKRSQHNTSKRVLKVILKEEPPPKLLYPTTKIDANSDKQSRTYSTNESSEYHRNVEAKNVFSTMTTPPQITALATIPVGPFTRKSKVTGNAAGSTQNMSSANKFDVKKCERPPTCPNCPPKTEPSATRKLCAKDHLKEVILELLNMQNSCEMDLIQARMKKQRAKAEARSREEEFYKFYRCHEHRAKSHLACVKSVKKPCEELLCQNKQTPPTQSLGRNSQDSFDVTRCMHSMKSKSPRKKEEEEEEEEKYCEIKGKKSVRKPSKDYKLMKNAKKMCPNEEPDNEDVIARSDRKGIYDDFEFAAKKNLTEHQVHARRREQKKLSQEWKSFKKNKEKEREKEMCKDEECKDDGHQKEEAEEEKKRAFTTGLCSPCKAEKYQFDKNAREYDLEIVIEDHRTEEMKEAEARLKETAEARAAAFGAGQQPKLSDESRRLIEKKYDYSKQMQRDKDKREREEMEEKPCIAEECKGEKERHSATRMCIDSHPNKERYHREHVERNPEKRQRFRYEEQERMKYGRSSEHRLSETGYDGKDEEAGRKAVDGGRKSATRQYLDDRKDEIKQQLSGTPEKDKYTFEDIDCTEYLGQKEKSHDKQERRSRSGKSKKKFSPKTFRFDKMRRSETRDDDMHLERDKTSYSSIKVMKNHLENESKKELMRADMRAKLEQEREAFAREKEKEREEEEKRQREKERKERMRKQQEEERERQRLEEEKERQLEKERELELEQQREREAAQEKERKRAALLAKEQQEKEEKQRREADKEKVMQRHAECMKPVIYSHIIYADQVSKAGTEANSEVSAATRDTTVTLLSKEIERINAQASPRVRREENQLTAQDAQHGIHKSLHVCYSTEKDEVPEQQKDDQIKYYPKICKAPPEYRLEPIRNERQNFVDKEIKRLETMQKDIKLDDSKRLFYQDQIKKVQQKLADIEEKRRAEAHKNIESVSDYGNLTCIDTLSLKTTSDLIAEKVYQKLLKASEKKDQLAEVKSVDDMVSDIMTGNRAMLNRTGVRVVKQDGSVTEVSAGTVNSAKSRLPQNVWTQKISAAMQRPGPTDTIRLYKGPMGQMGQQVVKEIESLKCESKSTTSLVRVDSKSSNSQSSALVKTNVGPAMIEQSKTPPKWKYLDPANTYDYTHFEKSDKSGLQIQRCMNEVKKCLNNYKKCLVDFQLMPKMDKHFDYDNVYTNSSSPSLTHRRSEEVLVDDDEDARSLKKSNSCIRVDKRHGYAPKCTTTLNVPMLPSGQHPITSKKKSNTSVFGHKSRQHHSVDFDPPGRDQGSKKGICSDKAVNAATSAARSSDANSIGVNDRSKNLMTRPSVYNPSANRRYHASMPEPKDVDFYQKPTDATNKEDVFDEVTLYFPRGEECVNVELLFHSDRRSMSKSDVVDVEYHKKSDDHMRTDIPPAKSEAKLSQDTFFYPAITEDKADVSEKVAELVKSKEFARSRRKYSYTKLPRPDLRKLEEDVPEQASLKPMEAFQQMYEATANKLRNMSYKSIKEKTLGYIYGEDDFWPTNHYPQILARLETPTQRPRPLVPQRPKPVVSQRPEPVVRPVYNSPPSPRAAPIELQKPRLRVQENLRQITARVIASQRANPHCTMCRVRALERQRNTTNIFKDACDEIKNNSDKCSEDPNRRHK